MMPTLHTLTGNLLAERTLHFDRWSPGHTQRARSESFQTGGKGINVSRMLVRLGAPTLALCFAGGDTGDACLAWLRARAIPHHAFPSSCPTRSGTVIRSALQPETTFLGPDAPPDAAAWEACAAHLDALPDGHVLALCGSFPGWKTPAAAPLRAALQRWTARGTLVADTYGPPLDWALAQPLALVKINRDEFAPYLAATTANTPAASDDLASALPAALAQTQIRAWIITDGAGPVWLAQRGSPLATRFDPPAVPVVSPTGSGDVLLACLLHAHHHLGLPLPQALAHALPYASANAAHPGIAEFDLNKLPS